MTTEFFCPCCGIREKNNTVRGGTGDHSLTCCSCGAGIRFYITLKPSRTQEEADAIFEQTELTDSQRGSKRRFSSRNSKT